MSITNAMYQHFDAYLYFVNREYVFVLSMSIMVLTILSFTLL